MRTINLAPARRLGAGILALALLLASPAPSARAGWPAPGDVGQAGAATADQALDAALAAYELRTAPGATFQLERHYFGAWAYAIAQEVTPPGQAARERPLVFLAHAEPGLGWQALAPGLASAASYNALLRQFPDQLLDAGWKAFLEQPEVRAQAANLSGYRFPWPAGQIAYLTQKDGPGHEGALDFDIRGLAAAGDVYAAKPGTVVFVKESSTSGACVSSEWPKSNMVVLQHGPQEFSWYVHLAPNSVPVAVGDHVGFGTKIGVEGETGYACGVHLHFMVSTGHSPWTDPADPNLAPWATGVTRVDFAECSWADLVEGRTYVSSNDASVPSEPPAAPTLLIPTQGSSQPPNDDFDFVWEPSPEATEYLVEWWGGPYAPSQPCGWTATTYCHLGRVELGGTYSWHVKARNSAGESAWSPTWTFTIETPPPQLQLVGALSLSPGEPLAGQAVTAQFTVKNVGPAAALLTRLGVAVRGPGCADWACPQQADWPVDENVVLAAGEEYTFCRQRSFEAGDYLAMPAYQEPSGVWHEDIPGAQQISFAVAPAMHLYIPLAQR